MRYCKKCGELTIDEKYKRICFYYCMKCRNKIKTKSVFNRAYKKIKG